MRRIVLAVLFVLSAPVSAATVSIEVSGQIARITEFGSGSNGIGVGVGDSFSSSIIAESNQSGGFLYSNWLVTVGGASFSETPGPNPSVLPFFSFTPNAFFASSRSFDKSSVDGVAVDGVTLQGDILSPSLFGPNLPTLGTFAFDGSIGIELFGIVGGVFTQTLYSSPVSSITFRSLDDKLNPVPLPAGIWLFLTGIGGLVGWRKHSQTQTAEFARPS